MPTRSWASALRITAQPSPIPPSTASGPAHTSSKNTSLRWWGPSIDRIGPHRDAGRVHGDDEHRDALMALARADPRRQHAPLGHAGVGGPDLLAGDAVAVAVLDGAGAERGQVGARLGFAEALAPDHVAGGDGREVLLLLGVGAEGHDRRTHPVEAHVLGAARLVVGPHLLAHHGLVPHRAAGAAVLGGPGEGEQTLLGERLAEALGDVEVGGIAGERAEVVRPRCASAISARSRTRRAAADSPRSKSMGS